MLAFYIIFGILVWLFIGTLVFELVAKYDDTRTLSDYDWSAVGVTAVLWPCLLLCIIPTIMRKLLFRRDRMR